MVEKIGNITLNLDYYPGEDFYSDGAIEDEMVEIARKYPETAFPDVITERGSWPIMYHLSPFRHNIIDWLPIKKTDKVLEIGSGCGAITGAIASKAGSVTCVDLSKKRSLVNAYRNQKYDNITIVLGNFEEVEPHLDCDYDYVLLIGVFEYGQAYIDGTQPYETFLSIINKHRKADGKIAIAIENKFGLKYWAGCREDHLGTYFSGLENYREGGSARTFTRRGLEEILKKVGIEDYTFYYPYPDYKFMTTVFSDKQLPQVGDLSDNLRNFDRNRMLLFDEKTVFDTILEEKEFPLFSNSYFLFIGEAPDCIYSKFSNDRADEYAIRTDIVLNEQKEKVVVKHPVTEKACEHIANMKEAYRLLTERFANGEFVIAPFVEQGDALAFTYMQGVSLERCLDECLANSDMNTFKAYIEEYMRKIASGDTNLVSNYDLIFSNIILKDKEWQMIDYEWSFAYEIPVKRIAFRAFYTYLLGSERRKCVEEYLLHEVLKLTEVEKNSFVTLEKEFQKRVTGTRASMGDMREIIGCVAPDMKFLENQYVSDYHKYAVQIYEDYGNGFSEKDSYFIYNCYENRKDVHCSVEVNAECQLLRVDPAGFPCLVSVRNLSINGNNLAEQECLINGKRLKNGLWLFPTHDPNITIKVNNYSQSRAVKLEIDMEVVEISLELAEKIKNNNSSLKNFFFK